MKTFAQLTEAKNYELYLEAIRLHETGQLNEFISSITGKLKKYYNFIKDIATTVKLEITEIADMLKNRNIFAFFTKIRFSLKKLYDLVKTGFAHYRSLQKAIARFIAETRIVKWTSENLKKLDDFLNKHPILKRLTGFAVGAILLYIWLNMAFTGDFDYDFDQSALIGALTGSFTLTALFSGEDGVRLLGLFAAGMFLSFPWPGPQGVLFVFSILYGLAKIYDYRELIPKLETIKRRIL